MNKFNKALRNNDKYNDRIKNDDPLYYLKYFEKFIKRIKFIYKDEHNRILVVSGNGLGIWDLINKSLYFNFFISNKNKNYDTIEEKMIEEFK